MKRNHRSASESVRRNWELENKGAYTDPKGNIHFADGTFASKDQANLKFDEFFRRLGDPVYTRRGIVASMYKRYSTDDVIRMNQKLINPDFKGLMFKADQLMEEEGIELYVPESSEWTEGILQHMHYDIEIREDEEEELDRKTEYERRRDVTRWRDAFSEVLEEYSYARLDLSWDLAWSFYVTYRRNFRQGHLKVYASIMGPVPSGLDDVPFQSVLTSERKLRQRRRRDRLAKAVLKKDRTALLDLGLNEEEILKAFERADIVLQRRAPSEAAD